MIRTKLAMLALTLAMICGLSTAAISATGNDTTDWHKTVDHLLPLYGHRNWICVVDSAYPAQSSPGVTTVESNEDEATVVKELLAKINSSIHVRADVYMDNELPFVKDSEAPGADAFRSQIKSALGSTPVTSMAHEALIAKLADAGSSFNVLIIKTNMTIPYTSVFLNLQCKYWSADQNAKMRADMDSAGVSYSATPATK